MSSPQFLTMAIWIAPIPLQLLIAVIMVRRGLFKELKYFFVYCICTPLRDVILFATQSYPNLYSLIYWIGDGVLILLQIAVFCEAIVVLVPVQFQVRTVAVRILRASVTTAIAFALVLFFKDILGQGGSIETILVLERFERVVQVIVIVAAMSVVYRWRLAWRNYATGILIGSGIAGLQLIPVALRGTAHLISDSTFILLKSAIYDCAVIAWTLYFLSPQKPMFTIGSYPSSELREWNGVLKEYLYR
jgi:hypothetical protein